MKGKIALFVNHPQCSLQSANGIIEALGSHYRFKIFSRYPVYKNFFEDVDIIAVPGGIGDANTFNRLMSNHKRNIRKYMNSGGRYLGICMGAYWAGKYYLNILEKTNPVQYIKRPQSVTKRPHAKNMPIEWQGQSEQMFFYDGCTFTGGDYDIVSTYPNDYPMAIFQRRIGLIGCHPESTEEWYNHYSYMAGQYHGGKHHKLLLEFVENLMQRP